MHAESMPCPVFAQALRALEGLARLLIGRYSLPVAANSATGFGDPISNRRTGAHTLIAGAFFVPAVPCYGGRAWETERSAGFLLPRFANLRTAATHNCLATVCGSSSPVTGAPPMKHPHALNPSAIQQHADALKARAFAALRADSSLSVRLRRYNEAMAKARALEAIGGAQ